MLTDLSLLVPGYRAVELERKEKRDQKYSFRNCHLSLDIRYYFVSACLFTDATFVHIGSLCLEAILYDGSR